MSDLEDEMEETAERARALGVSGSQREEQDERGQTDDADTARKADESTEAVEASETKQPLETLETSETVESSETLETSEGEDVKENGETPVELGGVTADVYPNPDKNVGSLIDTYENFNVYVPPEVKQEINAFYKQLDYEFAQAAGNDLDKHWDFYAALFRAVLKNKEIVREELGME